MGGMRRETVELPGPAVARQSKGRRGHRPVHSLADNSFSARQSHSGETMSSIFGPTGDPTLDRLGAFIDEYRRRMDNRNNNLFAASTGAWWRYYEFLATVLARYERSNAE